MDQEESKIDTEHNIDQEERIVDTEHNTDEEENKLGSEKNIDQEVSKMGNEHNMDQEECGMGTEHNTDQEESKIITVDSMDQDESKMGTEDNMDQEKSRVDTEHNMDQDESKIDTVDNLDQDESKMGTEDNMDQEKSRVDTEHNMDQEESKMGTKNLPDFSSSPNPQSSENDDSKKDTGLPEGSSKPELSEKITPQSLKAKKIVKKSLVGVAKLKAKKNKSTPQIVRKKIKRKIKKVGDNAESSHKEDDKQISDSPRQNEPPKEKNQEAGNNDVKKSHNTISNDQSPTEKSHQDKKDEEINLSDKTEQEQKSEEKHTESNKGSRRRKNKNKQKGKEKNLPNDQETSLPNDKEKSLSNDKKSGKLGGLIFMCSAKTKPDCFRYRVMGVSAAKKDDILKIKPGLKLFLYDFDLKLLYGIYKASSSGRMKLEPRAFGGKFPAQVRFKIVSDSFPLPESIFKKAIKDNYNKKNKFKPELTVAQVRKLTRLFRPVGAHSAVQQPVYSPPKTIIREREVPGRVRESQHHSHRERAAGHRFERREDIPRDSFLMEMNYRAYDRRNVATTSHVNPIMEPYERDYEHRLVEPRYRSNVPAHVESLRRDPIYLNDREQQSYTRVFSDHINDPYAYRYGASSRDAYLAPLSREDIAPSSYLAGGRPFSGTDNLRRREIVDDRHYSIYSAADSLPDYHPIQPYRGDKLESSPIRVSARYSFAGPSFSRR
ncbi:unnamed protein product [Trifolium pratense]|uniref:Uncharacterized protein n=1 Tax=Trifolium pratense TaxID=57577 RepID=A0ACB0J4T6_TRIPR|nr:unnamed protein product [Trifolium pratense]